jgi:tripartite-type tricarboxylate transporter receptor subunit TctC
VEKSQKAELRRRKGLVPAETPAPAVDRLNKEIKAILDSDEVKKLFLNEGSEANYLGPTEFGTLLKKEMTTWELVIKKANIKLEE